MNVVFHVQISFIICLQTTAGNICLVPFGMWHLCICSLLFNMQRLNSNGTGIIYWFRQEEQNDQLKSKKQKKLQVEVLNVKLRGTTFASLLLNILCKFVSLMNTWADAARHLHSLLPVFINQRYWSHGSVLPHDSAWLRVTDCFRPWHGIQTLIWFRSTDPVSFDEDTRYHREMMRWEVKAG